MRQIKITREIKDSFASIIRRELSDPDSIISNAYSAIMVEKAKYSNLKDKYKILDELSNFERFLLLTPVEQENLIHQWDKNNPQLFRFKSKKTKRFKKNAFCFRILKALNYEKFRNVYAAEIAQVINVKTCPYCNAALTIVTQKSKGEKYARFQLDHYFPKSRYPLLSISFFNLIPSCNNCNQSKSSKPPSLGKDFHLYTEDNPKDLFEFEIPRLNVAKFILSRKQDDIEIILKSGLAGDIRNTDHHNKSFNIKGIYNTQKDVAEELLLKYIAYNKSQIDDLSAFLSLPKEIISRMIIGNYIDREDIHKRPLAKFQQDIARQLGLIK